ncbi:carboxymuconolactone decarboxylase family protein [Phaeodactylibacter sp.]|uniref:carboxymuconolactone decarboxylase family protein n=1 Tax=Phaeodactylibacter sp. TaxID=1940289 RepID=UPI0026001676|nr:carboxymuconolactone decarboxylase family protein [Phaeodactylibacter sp.]MCI5092360.1 carboxymuconolactone decarboxylase family protein [Phaeodactylibacter sp.]
MAYIDSGNNRMGIVELLLYKPVTGKIISEFTNALLQGPSPLSVAQREMIATFVSHLNGCEFCYKMHKAVMESADAEEGEILECAIYQVESEKVTPKLKALLKLAKLIQSNELHAMEKEISNAHAAGASDEEIHDTVLISSAFCMFNRYVDGLGANLPKDEGAYSSLGAFVAKQGYKSSLSK